MPWALCPGILSASEACSEHSEPEISLLPLAILAFLASSTSRHLAWPSSRLCLSGGPTFSALLVFCLASGSGTLHFPIHCYLMSLVLVSPSCGPVSISLETSGFFCRHWTKKVWESGVRADLTLSKMDAGEPGTTQASVPQAHHFKPESSGSSWSPGAGDCPLPSLLPPPAHLCWHSVSQASSSQTFLPSKWAFWVWASPPRLFMTTPAYTERSLALSFTTLTWHHP